MMDATKYHVGYYPPPVEPGHVYEWTKKDHIEKAPAWCKRGPARRQPERSIVPMSLDEKLEFFETAGQDRLQGDRGRLSRPRQRD